MESELNLKFSFTLYFKIEKSISEGRHQLCQLLPELVDLHLFQSVFTHIYTSACKQNFSMSPIYEK